MNEQYFETLLNIKTSGKQDLDDTGQIKNIIAKASIKYKELAHNEKIQALSKIKYRNSLREAIYKLADEQVGN